MKKILKYISVILIIAFCMAPIFAFSYDNLSSSRQPAGFRGIYWGESKSEHSYLFSMYNNVDGFETFNRECEKQILGTAKLNEVAYHFYHDKFYRVSIILNSSSDHQHLLDALTSAYGAPEKESDVYVWANDTVVVRLFSEGASISYLPVLNKINQKYSKV